MEAILSEIEKTMATGLWYAAIVLCLTLPDICATLEAQPNARNDGYKARYMRWVRRNMRSDPSLSPDEFWALRSGVVHEGRFKHREYRRIAFTLPQGNTMHRIVSVVAGKATLSLSADDFCNEMVGSVRRWFDAKKGNALVKRNLED